MSIFSFLFNRSKELIVVRNANRILIKENELLQKEKTELMQQVFLMQNKINELRGELETLKKSLISNPKLDELNNKYPKANIEYIGRTFGTSKDMIPIDVRLLITPQDFHIQQEIKDNNLQIKDPETDVPKIYKYIYSKYYKYVEDQINYGLPELWEFPFEILEKKRRNPNVGFDCDSWANFQASFYIAAGMPSYKVRAVAGMSKLGGHSTVYVYSDIDSQWHHLNSTYGLLKGKISEFPTTDDAGKNDNLGIYDVWFSFNSEYSWHIFKTSSARDSFDKNKNKFIIKTKL